MRAGVLTASLLAVLCLGSACSSSKCESVCEDANACEVNERPADVECTPYCEDVEAFQARAVQAGQEDCNGLFEAHLDCWESNSSQICSKEFTGCTEAATAWRNCMGTYCKTEAGKTDVNCSGGNTRLLPF
ncbi:hypothetical protein [Stigmatella erecta]|uniref:Uncharacterized protein n=1 Tax=Stigmatella erecta TaxID=83460 RepID=A0A1I0JIU4_9BACT|nr:hypothetical protein [Stigmatella erecta]SEU10208.1 hypothetical protein SAMN05443639_107326 [Stigmatella erecta]